MIAASQVLAVALRSVRAAGRTSSDRGLARCVCSASPSQLRWRSPRSSLAVLSGRSSLRSLLRKPPHGLERSLVHGGRRARGAARSGAAIGFSSRCSPASACHADGLCRRISGVMGGRVRVAAVLPMIAGAGSATARLLGSAHARLERLDELYAIGGARARTGLIPQRPRTRRIASRPAGSKRRARARGGSTRRPLRTCPGAGRRGHGVGDL